MDTKSRSHSKSRTRSRSHSKSRTRSYSSKKEALFNSLKKSKSKSKSKNPSSIEERMKSFFDNDFNESNHNTLDLMGTTIIRYDVKELDSLPEIKAFIQSHLLALTFMHSCTGEKSGISYDYVADTLLNSHSENKDEPQWVYIATCGSDDNLQGIVESGGRTILGVVVALVTMMTIKLSTICGGSSGIITKQGERKELKWRMGYALALKALKDAVKEGGVNYAMLDAADISLFGYYYKNGWLIEKTGIHSADCSSCESIYKAHLNNVPLYRRLFYEHTDDDNYADAPTMEMRHLRTTIDTRIDTFIKSVASNLRAASPDLLNTRPGHQQCFLKNTSSSMYALDVNYTIPKDIMYSIKANIKEPSVMSKLFGGVEHMFYNHIEELVAAYNYILDYVETIAPQSFTPEIRDTLLMLSEDASALAWHGFEGYSARAHIFIAIAFISNTLISRFISPSTKSKQIDQLHSFIDLLSSRFYLFTIVGTLPLVDDPSWILKWCAIIAARIMYTLQFNHVPAYDK